MWIKVDMYKTGINIDTVNWSNKNSQEIDIYSDSIQLNKLTETGEPQIPTSKKETVANKEAKIKQVHVMKCAPDVPIFLPIKPETKEPKKGKIKIERYIKI